MIEATIPNRIAYFDRQGLDWSPYRQTVPAMPGGAVIILAAVLLVKLEDLPVIFLSAYGRDETIVKALDAGAADYLVKPFSPSELTARVRAALRRQAGPEPFRLGELAINYEERSVTVAGRPVELTFTEFEVLSVLSRNAGRTLNFESLLRQAWGGRGRGSENPKKVRAIMKTLRRKLGDDASNPAWVRNQRGVGYRMPRPGEG